MNKQDLKNLIVDNVKRRTGKAGILRLVLGEYEKYEYYKNPVTVEQVVRKLIESNNQCLASRYQPDLVEENDFLKTLLPSYLTADEIRDKIKALELDKSDKSVGKAISYLKSTGLAFLPEDVKKVIEE